MSFPCNSILINQFILPRVNLVFTLKLAKVHIIILVFLSPISNLFDKEAPDWCDLYLNLLQDTLSTLSQTTSFACLVPNLLPLLVSLQN